MSLGQNLSVGAIVAIYGPGGGGTLYPALVTAIQAPLNAGSSRQISGIAFPPGPGGPVPFLSLNHRSLTADGSGWDFGSQFPSVAL
jgi:hypothetical protein